MNLFDYNLHATFYGNPFYTYNTDLESLCFNENNEELNEKKFLQFQDFIDRKSQKCIYKSLLLECFEDDDFKAKKDHLFIFYSLTEHELELFYQFHIQFFSIDIEKIFYNPKSAYIFFILALIFAKFPNHFINSVQNFGAFQNVRFVYMEETFMFDLICHLLVKYERPNFILRHFHLLTFTELSLFVKAMAGINIRKIPLFVQLPTKHEFSSIFLNDFELINFEDKIFLRYYIFFKLFQISHNLEYVKSYFSHSKILMYQPELFMLHFNDWRKAFELLEVECNLSSNLYNKIDFLDASIGKDGFSLAKRDYNYIVRLSREWHQQYRPIIMQDYDDLDLPETYLRTLKKPIPTNYKWKGLDIFDYSLNFEDTDYMVVQLKQESDLIQEGNTMNHCVSSYVDVCKEGHSSIWSFRKKVKGIFKPYITIEIRKNQLVQASKKANRQPNKKDIQMLKVWLDLVGFEFGIYFDI